MANQQTDTVVSPNQPLNNPLENDNSENTPETLRNTRITKIKEKVLPGFKITLLISLIVYIAMLAIGIRGVHKCPVEENIPLFLIATGAIGLMTKIITYTREHILRYFQAGYIESSLYTVELVFLILGSYWVYKEYPPAYDSFKGCDKTTYLTAFIYVTCIWAIFFAALAGFAFFLCCICTLARCVSTNENTGSGTGSSNEARGENSA